MLEKSTLHFLKQLAANNERAWFKAHEEEYRAAHANMLELVEACIGAILTVDKQVVDLTPKKALFRIYRDVRFSKNKTPYKEWFSAVLTKDGKQYSQAGYYMRIQPGHCFIGGGFYGANPEQLDKIRKAIGKDSKPLRKAISSKKFKNYFTELGGDTVKTAPRGYSKTDPNIDLIRHKSFMMSHHVSDQKAVSKDFPAYVAEVCKAMRPVNDYINTVIGKRLD